MGHWSKIRLPDVPWLPPRGTPGHMLIVLVIWCVLGFVCGAAFTFLYIGLQFENVIEWGWPPTLLQPWIRWVVLGGGIVGAVMSVCTGWKQYPKDLT